TLSVWFSVFFFFERRSGQTILASDWSSAVCSPDLATFTRRERPAGRTGRVNVALRLESRRRVDGTRTELGRDLGGAGGVHIGHRSEERRVGKEGRSRGARGS